jgi:hypothetical protein
MKIKNRKTLNSLDLLLFNGIPGGSESSARLPSDYSHPTLAVKGAEEYSRTISTEVQLTIRSKVQFTRKQLCMLSGIALSEVAEKGLTISDWIVLEWLYSTLLGNKLTPYERKDHKEFELSLLLKIVLLGGTWMGLEGEKVQLPQDIQKLILSSKLVPSGRTKASWQTHWNIKNYIEFRIVPLDLLLERSKDTSPYSSYCKGYGESNRTGRRQKTRPSMELDGEVVDLEKDKTMSLDFSNLTQLFTAVLLETKYSMRKR